MPKSPPARSPLPLRIMKTAVRAEMLLLDTENKVMATISFSRSDMAEANANYLRDAANLLPEMVRELQDEHDGLIERQYDEKSFKHKEKPCDVCQLISRAKEALGQGESK